MCNGCDSWMKGCFDKLTNKSTSKAEMQLAETVEMDKEQASGQQESEQLESEQQDMVESGSVPSKTSEQSTLKVTAALEMLP